MRIVGASVPAVAGILLVLGSFSATALSGTDLYRSCMAKNKSLGDLLCIAYVHGFLDGIVSGHGIGKNAPTLYCPPEEGVSVDQGRLIVEKYLREHPEQLHEQAGIQVTSAMIEAFRCRNSK
jgi:hypothetical protein